jgi:hypothetical protein
MWTDLFNLLIYLKLRLNNSYTDGPRQVPRAARPRADRWGWMDDGWMSTPLSFVAVTFHFVVCSQKSTNSLNDTQPITSELQNINFNRGNRQHSTMKCFISISAVTMQLLWAVNTVIFFAVRFTLYAAIENACKSAEQ